MNVWQVAAGSDGRDYCDRFLRYGMAFVGGDTQRTTLSQGVQLGDKLILKRGMGQIVAVGEVVTRDGKFKDDGDKDWLRDFDGWDLRAWCYVDWHKPTEPIPTTGLTRATIQKVSQPHLLALTEKLLSSTSRTTSYDPEPISTKEISDENLISSLIQLGLRPSAAEDMTQALRRIRLLTRFYLNREDRSLTNEHDARTFLVIPLLIALGWAEQKIKIELPVPGGGRVDVGCFAKPYSGTDDQNQCTVLIETKGLAQGLDYATSQAHRYAINFPACKVVIATNGYCYKAFERRGDTFSSEPTAYLNIDRLRDRYPLNPGAVGGAIDVLRLLLPTS